ncbi:MAG: DUF2304 domain-containing protein [Nitrospirae bacterium]|nr:DUF2304 domain-containing protein [Nitrospirota bacterium]
MNIRTEHLGLNIKAEIFLIAIAIVFALFIFRQLKKKKLDEKYTILWFLIAIIIITLPLLSPLIDKMAYLSGFNYPPTVLFVVVILIILMIILHYSIDLTKLKRQNHLLAQELAIQENEINKLRKKVDEHYSRVPGG